MPLEGRADFRSDTAFERFQRSTATERVPKQAQPLAQTVAPGFARTARAVRPGRVETKEKPRQRERVPGGGLRRPRDAPNQGTEPSPPIDTLLLGEACVQQTRAQRQSRAGLVLLRFRFRFRFRIRIRIRDASFVSGFLLLRLRLDLDPSPAPPARGRRRASLRRARRGVVRVQALALCLLEAGEERRPGGLERGARRRRAEQLDEPRPERGEPEPGRAKRAQRHRLGPLRLERVALAKSRDARDGHLRGLGVLHHAAPRRVGGVARVDVQPQTQSRAETVWRGARRGAAADEPSVPLEPALADRGAHLAQERERRDARVSRRRL